MKSVKELQKNTFDTLKENFGYKNKLQAPKLVKVVISTGVGKTKADKKKMELIVDRLKKITGQKPAERLAKKSIASFKVREGQLSGFQVTLRGPKMYDFMDRLLNIALPRTRDFRGIKREAVDAVGNYSLGIKEHTIFPETSDEDIRDVFGLSITVVTTAKSKKECEVFLEHLGFPFKK
jgi:large subunit ribosomal protein L5